MASGSQLSLPLHALPSFACLLEATAVSVSKTWNALRDREPVETNASRDMHACMEKMGYTIPVEVHTMNHHSDLPKPITSYHIKPESWIQHWANDCPELLAGWNGNRRENFSAFWHAYQVHHPSHKVFTEHEGRLRDVVPIILHGDEGRGQCKRPLLILSFQPVLGWSGEDHVNSKKFFGNINHIFIWCAFCWIPCGAKKDLAILIIMNPKALLHNTFALCSSS